MIMAYYDKWVPLEQVRLDCGVSRDGSNARNMLIAARNYGFEAQGFRCEIDALRREIQLPCIIHWNFDHFVVLRGFRGRHALLNDPARGDVKVSLEELDRSFTGICLQITPGEGFQPGGKPKSTLAFARKRLTGAGAAVAFVMLSTVIVSLFGIIGPIFSNFFMDRLLTGENRELLDRLKKDLGFDGFLLTDWNAIKTASGNSYEEKLIKSVNAGADRLMEVDNFDEVGRILKEAVRSGKIPEERINDAAARIIRVKQRAGLFSDPFKEADDLEKLQQDLDQKSRDTACALVEKSLVLLKNENKLLPIKPGTKIYVAGPAADNAGVQGGGWTVEWQGVRDASILGFTTLLDGLRLCEDRYGLTIITDPEKAAEADVVLLALGEVPYAEYQGDSYDPDLLGKHGLSGNQEAMQEAQALKKPVITCIMAGRQVFIADYMDQWDSVVMCYLPGSEGQGIARVLLGETDFTGKLPSPWFASVKDLEAGKPWLKTGYGLSMK